MHAFYQKKNFLSPCKTQNRRVLFLFCENAEYCKNTVRRSPEGSCATGQDCVLALDFAISLQQVRLLHMKRIYQHYLNNIYETRKPISVVAIRSGEYSSSDSFTRIRTAAPREKLRETKLAVVKQMERDLKRYEKKNKKIMKHTAYPVYLSKMYKEKYKRALEQYEEEEEEFVKAVGPRVGRSAGSCACSEYDEVEQKNVLFNYYLNEYFSPDEDQ